MELALAILMVLGIFVGVPAVIGFAIAGAYMLRDRQVRRVKRAKVLAEATEALERKVAQTQSEVLVKPEAAETAEKTLVGAYQKR
jgi:flagellar biosynthesis component FlhA